MNLESLVFNCEGTPPFLFNVVGRALFHPELECFSHPDSDEGSDESASTASSKYVRNPIDEGEPTEVIVVGAYGGAFAKRVFVIPEMWIEAKKILVKDMNDHFGKNDAQPPEQLISGRSYAVFFKGNWNRVSLQHLIDGDKAKLVFYDEGIIRRMYVDRIKHLPEKYLKFSALVVEVKALLHFPDLTKGDLITLEFRYRLRPDLWSVRFISGPIKMVNSMDMIMEKWLLDAEGLFPTKPRQTSDMVTLDMVVDEYKLPAPGVLIPVMVLWESAKHFIVTPVAWLKELENMIRGLPKISKQCRPLPFGMVSPGMSCAVPYAGGWFRARIRSVDGAATLMSLKVRLVDFGFILYVDRYEARVLPRQLLPMKKKPLCFAISKAPEFSRGLTIGEFKWIVLERKAEDSSWIAKCFPLEPGTLNITFPPYL